MGNSASATLDCCNSRTADRHTEIGQTYKDFQGYDQKHVPPVRRGVHSAHPAASHESPRQYEDGREHTEDGYSLRPVQQNPAPQEVRMWHGSPKAVDQHTPDEQFLQQKMKALNKASQAQHARDPKYYQQLRNRYGHLQEDDWVPPPTRDGHQQPAYRMPSGASHSSENSPQGHNPGRTSSESGQAIFPQDPSPSTTARSAKHHPHVASGGRHHNKARRKSNTGLSDS